MNRVLILGGTGVVGRAIALRFARLGWRVEVTGRDRANMPPELLAAGVSFVRADSRNASELAAALGAGADLDGASLVNSSGKIPAQWGRHP